MKTVFTVLGILMATVSFAQSNNSNLTHISSKINVSDLKISVTVDSVEEVESTFKVKDIKSVLTEIDTDENITFEIVCEGDMMSNQKRSSMTYSVTGNRNDTNGFLKSVRKIRKASIKYLKNRG